MTSPTPTDADPASAKLLHTDRESATLRLYLHDQAEPFAPANDLLRIESDGATVIGTGSELADIAHAILRHVEQPNQCRLCGHAMRKPRTATEEPRCTYCGWVPSGRLDPACGECGRPNGKPHTAECSIALEQDIADGGTDVPADVMGAAKPCEHPETRTETHTYCATPDGCGACLG